MGGWAVDGMRAPRSSFGHTLHVSSDETAERILEATWALLRAGGGVTMAGVADAVGISRQAVYLHVGSRAGLLVAVVRWVDRREGIAADMVAAADGRAPAAALEALVRTWLDYLPRLHPAPIQLLAGGDHEALAAWDDRMRELERAYRGPLTELHAQGELRPELSVRRAVELVRAVASLRAWDELVHGRRWSQRRAVDALWRAAAGAVLLAPPSGPT